MCTVLPARPKKLCLLVRRGGGEDLLAKTATKPQETASLPHFTLPRNLSSCAGKSYPRQRERRPTFWCRRKLKRGRERESERERERGESEVSECSREKQQGMKCILWKLKCKCTWPAIRAQPDMKPAGRLRWIERVQKRTRAKRPLGCERL